MGSPSSLQMTLSQLDQENQSDLPRAPLCPPSRPANSFCMSGHCHSIHWPYLVSTLVIRPPLQDGTQLTTFFSVLLPPGSCDLFFSDSSPHLTVLPVYSLCSHVSKDLSRTLYPLAASTLQPLDRSPNSDLPPPNPPSFSYRRGPHPQFLTACLMLG